MEKRPLPASAISRDRVFHPLRISRPFPNEPLRVSIYRAPGHFGCVFWTPNSIAGHDTNPALRMQEFFPVLQTEPKRMLQQKWVNE